MKIIGKDDRGDRFILDASRNEIANLIGFYYGGEHGVGEKIKIGSEIKVADMYQQLRNLAEIPRELEQMRGRLESTIELLKIDAPIISVGPDEKEVAS